MIADRQTDTDRQTDRQRDTLIALLRFHTGGAVINNAGDLFTVVPAAAGLYLFSLSIIYY